MSGVGFVYLGNCGYSVWVFLLSKQVAILPESKNSDILLFKLSKAAAYSFEKVLDVLRKLINYLKISIHSVWQKVSTSSNTYVILTFYKELIPKVMVPMFAEQP